MQQRRVVAAVEIVSPANKDRPEHRRAFVAKCAALLQERVSVVIVDTVTTRTQNLYQELLDLIGKSDAGDGSGPAPLYATACRTTKRQSDWTLETWTHRLEIGQPLPTLPLWLADDLAVPLELEDIEAYSAEQIQETINRLEFEMREHAKKFEFEKAAELRDRIKYLRERELVMA